MHRREEIPARLAERAASEAKAVGERALQRGAGPAKRAAWEGTQLGAGTLLVLLAVVVGLLAVLAALAFAVVALAGPLPAWAAGLVGAGALAVIALGLWARGRHELRRNETARTIGRVIEEGRAQREDGARHEPAPPYSPPRRDERGPFSSSRR